MDYPIDFPSRTPSALEPEPLERIRKLKELVSSGESQQYESAKRHSKNSNDLAQQTDSSASSPRNERLNDDVT
jgi:hypothetical protein